MRLYIFEHCSLCFRVRMTAALKQMHLQEVVVLDDDTETLVSLVQVGVFPHLGEGRWMSDAGKHGHGQIHRRYRRSDIDRAGTLGDKGVGRWCCR